MRAVGPGAILQGVVYLIVFFTSVWQILHGENFILWGFLTLCSAIVSAGFLIDGIRALRYQEESEQSDKKIPS